MEIKQFEIWIADLNPRVGTEAGKRRPVLIVQTDLLNRTSHPSSIVCPLTTNVQKASTILRVHISKGMAGMNKDCDVMIDQIRAIDNNRLTKRVGSLSTSMREKVKDNISIILDLTY